MSLVSNPVKIKITGWGANFNNVALTRFLTHDIKRLGRGELIGRGNVIYKLFQDREAIQIIVSTNDVDEFLERFAEWDAIFEVESN